MWVIIKTRCFHSLPLIHNQNFEIKIKAVKIQHAIFETFTKKSSLWNLSMFHDGPFELEILEIFTTAFLLETLIWTWIFFKYFRVLSWKTKEKQTEEWKPGTEEKYWKMRKKNKKMKNSQATTTEIFFTLTFLYGKIYILLENIFE